MDELGCFWWEISWIFGCLLCVVMFIELLSFDCRLWCHLRVLSPENHRHSLMLLLHLDIIHWVCYVSWLASSGCYFKSRLSSGSFHLLGSPVAWLCCVVLILFYFISLDLGPQNQGVPLITELDELGASLRRFSISCALLLLKPPIYRWWQWFFAIIQ